MSPMKSIPKATSNTFLIMKLAIMNIGIRIKNFVLKERRKEKSFFKKEIKARRSRSNIKITETSKGG